MMHTGEVFVRWSECINPPPPPTSGSLLMMARAHVDAFRRGWPQIGEDGRWRMEDGGWKVMLIQSGDGGVME